MPNEVVLLLDDDEKIHAAFKNLIEDLDLEVQLISCYNITEYKKKIFETKKENLLKSIIVDLANTKAEEGTKQFAIAECISKEYTENRIPIFIHSAFLQDYVEFEHKGTVFKINKSKDSIETICQNLKLFYESDFLNIFCMNGNIEQRIMNEIHSAFISQFENNEIIEIINSIKHASNENLQSRTKEVFERIAVRALYENLIRSKEITDGNIQEIKVNAIEHYYRRTSEYEFWTGDIFLSSYGTWAVIITPRCNLAQSNYDHLMVCFIKEISEEKIKEFSNIKKGTDILRRNITDDVTKTGERYRFLPATPQFMGGYVDFQNHYTFKVDEFRKLFKKIISLSNDLTNDISRKFSSYIMRLGISETDVFEASYFIKDNKKSD